MQIFYKELSLEDGFAVSDLPKLERIVAGREVSMASGIELFRALRGHRIRCWKCGCEADRWVVGKGQGDKIGRPVMNLFAYKFVPSTKKRAGYHKLVMMTRDHIIPKSLGGVDRIANLRPGCEDCNSQRGSKMTKGDKKFMERHPELIDPIRAAKGEATRKRLEEEAEKRRKHKEHLATLKELEHE